MTSTKVTPLMTQYFAIREQYSDCLLFFQVGDFYELFFEHAQQAAPVLGVVLTSRGTHNNQPIPLCGVPLHAVNHYVCKLIKAGFHVAMCDQLEEAKPGTVVKRGVTQVLTPSTLTDTRLLDEKRASYLCVCVCAYEYTALVFIEILTSNLFASVITGSDQRIIYQQLCRFMPDEIILESTVSGWQSWLKQQGFVLTEPVFANNYEYNLWLNKFSEQQIQHIKQVPILVRAFELLYAFFARNQPCVLEHITKVQFYKPSDFLILDGATQRNLELVANTMDGGRAHTLLSVLDRAVTAMGSRMIKRWILSPLVNPVHINARLDAVQLLAQDIATTQQLVELLAIGDLERVIGRIALDRAQLYDYVLLSRALEQIPHLINVLGALSHIALLKRILMSLGDFSALAQLLKTALNTDSTIEYLIKPGFDHQLDALRAVLDQAHERVLALEQREQERTGISTLKIRYNQIYGYSIEVTKNNLDSVPENYQRQQTLVGKERFVTTELIVLDQEIMHARSHVDQVEQEVYKNLKREVIHYLANLRQLAYALASLDALVSFALVAYDNNYCRPEINANGEIIITEGKHPVVSQVLAHDFIANDTRLLLDERFWIVTGPNMGGKSTYLRQVALISLMAHCGSFVPARQARIALLDRIFTRIGAGDNLAGGKSTFLVEMEETAVICQQATSNSLVILDEVGRGTSTYDGLAIAQAVLEYLYQQTGCYCLFATHYQELTALEAQLSGVVNYHAASKQQESGVLFLHKIIKGAAEGSFGIEVAQLAQLPPAVIARAREILNKRTGTS